MNKFCIIANKDRDEQMELTRQVESFLAEAGKQCYVRTESLAQAEEAFLPPEEGTDCVIVLGGDGTLIRAANHMLKKDIPLFGINAGTLGFLTAVDAVDAERGLKRLCDGDFRVENRMMLDVALNDEYHDTVLNEVAINRSGFSRLINIAVFVNGALLDTFSGDGLLVSTPTGSTGYNMSAGGAIAAPGAELIMITPICPHSLSSRGVIVSSEDEIEIEIVQGKRTQPVEAIVTIDNRVAKNLKASDRIVIKKSAYSTKMIQMDEKNFFEVLRTKLGSVERIG